MIKKRTHHPDRLLGLAKLNSMSEMRGECVVFTGYRNKDGYGLIRYKGKLVRAHRLSYVLYNGPLPDDANVCHSCDNPSCVREDHLFVGTQVDNIKDRVSKNRSSGGSNKGTRNHFSKLKPKQVLEIFRSTETNTNLSKTYGVSEGTIRMIRSGHTWKHLTKT